MKLNILFLVALASSEPAASDVFKVPISDLVMSVDYGAIGRFKLGQYTSEDTESICIAMPYAPPNVYDEILGNSDIRNTGIFPIDPPSVYIFYIDSENRVIEYENMAMELDGKYWAGMSSSNKSVCGPSDNVSLIIDRRIENPVPAIEMEIK